MALGSTQPLTEMSNRNIFWEIKSAGACGWPSNLREPIVLKSESLILLEHRGPLQACTGIVLPYPEVLKQKHKYVYIYTTWRTSFVYNLQWQNYMKFET